MGRHAWSPLLQSEGRPRRSIAGIASLSLAVVAALLCIIAVSQHGILPVELIEKCCSESKLDALKNTGLFWGDALSLGNEYDDDDEKYTKDPGDDEHAGLQAEADAALALCDEVAAEEAGQGGEPRRCVHRVVSKHDTRFTNTPAGRNEWEQDHWSRALGKIIDQMKPETEGIYEDGVITHVPVYDRSAFTGYKPVGRPQQLAMRSPSSFKLRRGAMSPQQARQQALFAAQAGGQHLWDVMPEIDVGGSPLWQPQVALSPPSLPPYATGPCALQPAQVEGGEWKGAAGPPAVGAAPLFSGCGLGGAAVAAAAPQQFWFPQPAPAPAPFAPPPLPVAAPLPAAVSTVPSAPVAQVSEATTVEQPFASASHLSTEQEVALGCGEEHEEGGGEGGSKYNVQVTTRTRGCGCGGQAGKTVWNGELDVQPVDCAMDVHEVKPGSTQ